MKSSKKPPAELVDRAVLRIASPEHQRYFFDRLQNPHWVVPLAERRLFADPPPAVELSDGRLRSESWPQSQYLARVAKLAPSDVAKVLREVRTNNWAIVIDMVEAANAMPAEQGALLAKPIAECLSQTEVHLGLREIGELVAKLARGGQTAAAMLLARATFKLRNGSTPNRFRSVDHEYFEALDNHVTPALAQGEGAPKLLKLLVAVALAAIAQQADGAAPDDYSYIWRPAIEDHEQNHDYEFAARFVGSLRKAFETAIRNGLGLTNALQFLERHEQTLFRRLRLHLICLFADQEPTLARAAMLEEAAFHDFRVTHEYSRLVGARFLLLESNERSTWLAWVEAGPPKATFDRDGEQQSAWSKTWRLQRLHWIRDHLQGPLRSEYNGAVEERGAPAHADMSVMTGVTSWSERPPPLSKEEFAAMGFDDVVAFLTQWKAGVLGPDGGPPHTTEGLALAFQDYVSSDVSVLSSLATQLHSSPARYVRSFLTATTEAVKQVVQVDSAAVLELCQAFLARPEPEPSDSLASIERRSDRQACRDAICELVRELCKAGVETPRLGIEHRDAAWRILAQLTDDTADSHLLSDGSEEDPRLADWPLLSINAPRGKAMLGVLEYADWVARHLAPARAGHQSFEGGFGRMPEVRTELERQLNRDDDYFTARAAFGWRLGLLYWLDLQWLRDNAERIFNLRVLKHDPARAFGWAAWTTFLFANKAHVEFYRLLHDQFSFAVDQAALLDTMDGRPEAPFRRLAEHIIVLFGRGNLGETGDIAWTNESSLLKRLLTESHLSVRSHAMRFIGFSLASGAKLPPEIAARFSRLWELYWEATGKDDARCGDGSGTFGPWFSSGAFDPQWSIVQYERAIAVSPRPVVDDSEMDQLAVVAKVDPLAAARIMLRLSESSNEYWHVRSWKESAKRVLQLSLAASGEAHALARKAIGLFGRAGHFDFGELMGA